MKEEEIQKPRANLTVCNGAEHLSNDNEGQENSGLCGLEADLVKLIRSQGGKLTKTVVQFCLINPQSRIVLFCFKWGLNCFYSVF